MNRVQTMVKGVTIAVAVLMAIGILRGLLLFLHDPLLAVANNHDLIRVQACIDAYPVRDATIPPLANSYEAPLERYTFIPGVGTKCFFTSESIFAFLSYPALVFQSAITTDRDFSIRWVGFTKLLALVIAGVLVTRALLRAGRDNVAVVHAMIFALVLMDPAATLCLSTFYAEFSSLLFAYLLIVLILLDGLRQGPAGRTWQGLLVASPILLSTSKLQHLPTALFILAALALAGALAGVKLRKTTFALLLAGSMIGAALQFANLRSDANEAIARANIVNTVMFAVLENASDPAASLAALKLPGHCADAIGKNWFTPGMQEGQHCPEVFAVSRIDVARALLLDPPMFAWVMVGAIERSRPWVPSYLGLVEGEAVGRLPAYVLTLSSGLARVPAKLYLALFLLLPVLGLVLARLAAKREDPLSATAVAILSLCPLPLLAVVALGDGYADTAKQSHLAVAMFLAGWLTASALTTHWAWSRFRGTGQPSDPTNTARR